MRSVEDLKAEIEERRRDLLRNGEIVDQMKEKVFYVPFMAMGSSIMTLFLGRKLIQSRADNPLKRPILFQFGNKTENNNLIFCCALGMGVLGAMLGAQLGALWLQKEYFKLDPEGKLLSDLKAIGNELKELKEQESKEK